MTRRREPGPRMHGYPTEGVLGIEICAAAPDEAAAVASVEVVGEDPTEWRVVGRDWRKELEDDWESVAAEEPGAVEFWEVLRKDEIRAREEDEQELFGE